MALIFGRGKPDAVLGGKVYQQHSETAAFFVKVVQIRNTLKL